MRIVECCTTVCGWVINEKWSAGTTKETLRSDTLIRPQGGFDP
ncbi:MAG: hypothetical protein SOY49_04300 [Prevotella sp.]|nr:hypothetical protein [Prevotella sp.]